MKPAARIQGTIDVLTRIAENTRVPMDSVIGDYMRTRRYIGSKDRNDIVERVYNMARSHARLGWWVEKFGIEDTARSRTIIQLMIAEGANDKRVSKDLFDGTKYAPEELSAQETHLVKLIAEGKYEGGGITHADMPVEVKVECPPLYEAQLKAYFGDDFESEMEALLTVAPLDLRVNTFLASREKAKDYLEADGVKTKTTPYSKTGLRCLQKSYLARTKAFAKGWVEIQDEGSQLIAQACDAKAGMQVLDYCAGAGGKTLALAAAMERKGRIVAMDNDERRLQKGRERYKKAKVADIIEIRPLEENTKWLKRQKGKFDIVLTDVPCSGSGTWRRNPDMRWRVFGPSLGELTAIQADILSRVAPLVKPGGKLVYATCSLFEEENEAQIENFLKEYPDFEIQPVDKKLGDQFMRLTPKRHNTDGFFTAVLQKQG